MSNEQDLNPETMPLADLKALALKEAADAEEAAKVVTPPAEVVKSDEQARDDKGRFAKSGESVDADEPQEHIVRREIDLGDGSGVQVFKGRGASQIEAYDDLADRLLDAQRNASKKIREQNDSLKKFNQSTADDNYVIAKQLQEKPVETIQQLVDRHLAEKAARETKQINEEKAIQLAWVAEHPEYIPTPQNSEALFGWIRNQGDTKLTEDNLEKAYQSLKASGLLKLKDESASDDTKEVATGTERIAQTDVNSTQHRSSTKGSSIRRSNGTPITPVKAEPSEDDLYDSSKFSLEELRKRANEQLSRQS